MMPERGQLRKRIRLARRHDTTFETADERR